jgi:hypothetical protein
MQFYQAASLAALMTCASAPSLAAVPQHFAAQLLQAHNLERRHVGASQLLWDWRLAAAADAYANYLARTGRWGHASAQQLRGQGENLWMGSRGFFTPGSMVANWAAGKRLFKPGIFPNVSRSGNWSHVGHYTQIVWPATTRVGCSIRSSAQWDYLVCRYSAPGNVAGGHVGPRRVASR